MERLPLRPPAAPRGTPRALAGLVLGVVLPVLPAVFLGGCRGPAAPDDGRAGTRVLSTPTPGPLAPADADPPRVLVVVAHPDDELMFGGLVYKHTQHLGGVADLVTITNGEGGFKYSTLAERIYGHELTDEEVGRRELPAIRARELRASCEVIGVRELELLAETDHRYSTDPMEVLAEDAGVWDLGRVRAALDRRLEDEAYDVLLVLTPSARTHGHHQAAGLLAVEAAARRPPGARPVVLCATPGREDGEPAAPELGDAATARGLAAREHVGTFDRSQPFGHRDALDYRIVVRWAVGEHRSQGTMQQIPSWSLEEYWLLGPQESLDDARRARLHAWFEDLHTPQFPVRTYGDSAGTNSRAGTGPR